MFDSAAEKPPDVTFAKVNTYEQQDLAGALGIRSIPTLMVLREQVLLFSQPGALYAGQFDELITKITEVDMQNVLPPRRKAVARHRQARYGEAMEGRPARA